MDETTDTTRDDPDDGGERPRNWRADAEAALDDVTTALQAAWAGSREARTEALEAARGALVHLGTAIDQATRAARDSWGDAEPHPASDPDADASAPPDEAIVPPPPTPPTTG